MANLDCAAALQVCATRVAILDANGAPAPGLSEYVSDALILLSRTPNVATGDQFEVKNGCGSVCVTYEGDDTLKNLTLDMQLCTPDPELIDMLTGGSVFTHSGKTVGRQPRAVGASQAYSVSVEVWCRAILNGAQDTSHPWWRFVFPKTRWQDGAQTYQNQPVDNILTGKGEQNANWYDGPAHDWFNIADQPITSLWGYARDTAIPTTACGKSTIPAS